jgi:hypothetical protein
MYSHSNAGAMGSLTMEFFATTDRCKRIVSDLVAVRNEWRRRNPIMSTFGTASYLDAPNAAAYEKSASQSNPRLLSVFPTLYDDILAYFRQRTNSRVEFRANCGYPGFHIFESGRVFSWPVTSVHRDLQFRNLRILPVEDIDYANTMSFTLALELPESGGGIMLFDESPSFFKTISLNLARKTVIPYKVGWMVTHNGQETHMILPCQWSDKRPRITLQGHGLFDKASDSWSLYW